MPVPRRHDTTAAPIVTDRRRDAHEPTARRLDPAGQMVREPDEQLATPDDDGAPDVASTEDRQAAAWQFHTEKGKRVPSKAEQAQMDAYDPEISAAARMPW